MQIFVTGLYPWSLNSKPLSNAVCCSIVCDIALFLIVCFFFNFVKLYSNSFLLTLFLFCRFLLEVPFNIPIKG